MRKAFFLAAALAAASLFTGTALADSPGITFGDAQALFQAGSNGGVAIRFNGGTVLDGAPVQPGRIAPTAFNNGRHLCSLDWHLLAILFFDAFPQSEDAYAQAVADLSTFDVVLALDGVPLALQTTPVKANDPAGTEAIVGPGFDGFWEQWGSILSPSDLSVGAHTLQLLGTSQSGSLTLPPITFFVDAEGSGACS